MVNSEHSVKKRSNGSCDAHEVASATKRIKQSRSQVVSDSLAGRGSNKENVSRYQKPPVQPLGNLLFSSSRHNARNPGLGSLSVLPDEILVAIFSELEAIDLLRAQGASHAFYAFTRTEGQWKHEYIKKSNGTLAGWAGTWRRTHLLRYLAPSTGTNYLPTDNLSIDDIYSDVLYVPHMAAQFDANRLANASRFLDNIPRLDARKLRKEDIGETPLILTNATHDWPAMEGSRKWSLKSLEARFPACKFRAESVTCTLGEYTRYYQNCAAEDSPLYLFDPDFVERTAAYDQMGGLSCDFSVPEVFDDDLFSLMGSRRPNYRWLIAGPARSGSTFHKDPNATSAWNAVITGRKLWILFRGDVVPPGITVTPDQAEVEAPLSIAGKSSHFLSGVEEKCN